MLPSAVFSTRPGTNRNQVGDYNRVYKALILPTLLFGCETWTINQCHTINAHFFLSELLEKKKILVPDTKVLTCLSMICIYTMLMNPQLRWSGHVVRMHESVLSKQILFSEPHNGKRQSGAPKRVWRTISRPHSSSLTLLQRDRNHWLNSIMHGEMSSLMEHQPLKQSVTSKLKWRDGKASPGQKTAPLMDHPAIHAQCATEHSY